ncbi:hypothetical protein ELE36_01660 [Pseudolysobacter antarcticus]|uniref:Uncharacterized protein n=1 Tax=Pseudolysobacter antarcticus TaxID=2511995 RepID=A0A411HFC0_9GAMM|nr:hypothetical protein [Pseudolysobacter antarcticus]QBB69185.1 hypothetical protein ELE36_01660 [Pseudolysobacter antarcticus]
MTTSSCAAATPQRTARVEAMLTSVSCGFGDEGGDADVFCNDDRGMFLCEILRAQKSVAGCSIDPSKSKVPDLDKLTDADFVKDGKMDQAAIAQPCIVWAYNEGYVAPNRQRWQQTCAIQLLDSLGCPTTSSGTSKACKAGAKPVCSALHQAGLVTACP